MNPNASGLSPRCRTRYTGSTLATISDEMSVSRLVIPSAQTVGLTIGSRRGLASLVALAGEVVQEAQVAQPRCVRVRSEAQSMAYIAGYTRKAPAGLTGLKVPRLGFFASEVSFLGELSLAIGRKNRWWTR